MNIYGWMTPAQERAAWRERRNCVLLLIAVAFFAGVNFSVWITALILR
jgi:hypothetical protein